MQNILVWFMPNPMLPKRLFSSASFLALKTSRSLLRVALVITFLSACNSSRNIDEDDRIRRLGDYSEEEWQEAAGGRQQVDSFRFQKTDRSGQWLKMQYQTNFWEDDWQTYVFGTDAQLYVDLEKKEVYTKSLGKPLHRFSTITCLPQDGKPSLIRVEAENCDKFTFAGRMSDFLPERDLDPRLAAIENVVTVQMISLDMDLFQFTENSSSLETGPFSGSQGLLLGKLHGINITTSLDDSSTQALYSDKQLPAGTEFQVRIAFEPEGVYWFDLPVSLPTAGLLFDRCEQNHGEAVIVECHFLNPVDQSVTTTKYGFKRNKTAAGTANEKPR